MRRLAWFLLVPVLVLVANGCNGGDEESIRTTYEEFFDAYRSGDSERACSLMTEAGQEETVRESKTSGLPIEGDTCEEIYKELQPTSSLGNPQLDRIEIRGNRAKASVTLRRGGGETEREGQEFFAKKGGDWLLDRSPPEERAGRTPADRTVTPRREVVRAWPRKCARQEPA